MAIVNDHLITFEECRVTMCVLNALTNEGAGFAAQCRNEKNVSFIFLTGEVHVAYCVTGLRLRKAEYIRRFHRVRPITGKRIFRTLSVLPTNARDLLWAFAPPWRDFANCEIEGPPNANIVRPASVVSSIKSCTIAWR